MSTFVLVHGSWGGGWIWSRVTSRLSDKGHTVYAPSLTGLGDRKHLLSPEVNLQTHIDDVANLLEYEQLENVVLVGHSYAGQITTGVLGVHPDRIGRMVYLDAYVPEVGQSCMDILPAFRAPLDEAATKYDGHYLDPMDPSAFGVSDAQDAAWIEERSTLMPYAPLKDPLPAPPHAPEALVKPTTFVNCTTSSLFADTAAAVRERGWTVHDVEVDHFVQVSLPDPTVAILEAAAA